MFVLKPWHQAIWITAIAGIAISVLAWFAWRDPEINYLPRDSRAEWITAIAGIAISILAWFAWRDPEINYLPRDSRAEWIVFPAAVDARAHWFARFDATFRREFTLTEHPSTGHLSIRAMRRAEVKINGTAVHFSPNGN